MKAAFLLAIFCIAMATWHVTTSSQQPLIKRRAGNTTVWCKPTICRNHTNTFPGFCKRNNTSDVCIPCPLHTCISAENDLNSIYFTGYQPDWLCEGSHSKCDLKSGTVVYEHTDDSFCPICRCKRRDGFIKLSAGVCEDASKLYPQCIGDRNTHQYLSNEGCRDCKPNQMRSKLSSGLCEDIPSWQAVSDSHNGTLIEISSNKSHHPTTPSSKTDNKGTTYAAENNVSANPVDGHEETGTMIYVYIFVPIACIAGLILVAGAICIIKHCVLDRKREDNTIKLEEGLNIPRPDVIRPKSTADLPLATKKSNTWPDISNIRRQPTADADGENRSSEDETSLGVQSDHESTAMHSSSDTHIDTMVDSLGQRSTEYSASESIEHINRRRKGNRSSSGSSDESPQNPTNSSTQQNKNKSTSTRKVPVQDVIRPKSTADLPLATKNSYGLTKSNTWPDISNIRRQPTADADGENRSSEDETSLGVQSDHESTAMHSSSDTHIDTMVDSLGQRSTEYSASESIEHINRRRKGNRSSSGSSDESPQNPTNSSTQQNKNKSTSTRKVPVQEESGGSYYKGQTCEEPEKFKLGNTTIGSANNITEDIPKQSSKEEHFPDKISDEEIPLLSETLKHSFPSMPSAVSSLQPSCSIETKEESPLLQPGGDM